MKHVFFILIVLSLTTGCAAMGKVLQGAGDGLSRSAQNNQGQVHCNPDYAGGYYCQSPNGAVHCTKDYAGGWNCQ